MVPEKSVGEVKRFVTETLDGTPQLKTEYYEIVDGHTMQPIARWEDSALPVGCVTAYCGDVRLIDNITYRI